MEVAVLCVLAFVSIAIGGPVVMYWRYPRIRIAMNGVVVVACLLSLLSLAANRWSEPAVGVAWPLSWALFSVLAFAIAFVCARGRYARLRTVQRGLPGIVRRQGDEPCWVLDGEPIPIVGGALDRPCVKGAALALDAEILEPGVHAYRSPSVPTRRLRAREIVPGPALWVREETWQRFLDRFLTVAAIGQLVAPLLAASVAFLTDLG